MGGGWGTRADQVAELSNGTQARRHLRTHHTAQTEADTHLQPGVQRGDAALLVGHSKHKGEAHDPR